MPAYKSSVRGARLLGRTVTGVQGAADGSIGDEVAQTLVGETRIGRLGERAAGVGLGGAGAITLTPALNLTLTLTRDHCGLTGLLAKTTAITGYGPGDLRPLQETVAGLLAKTTAITGHGPGDLRPLQETVAGLLAKTTAITGHGPGDLRPLQETVARLLAMTTAITGHGPGDLRPLQETVAGLLAKMTAITGHGPGDLRPPQETMAGLLAKTTAAVGRRAALSGTRRGALYAAGRPRAVTQQRAAQHATLRGGMMRGGWGPPCSFELNQARRYARSGTAKGRVAAALRNTRRSEVEGREAAAASCAARDAPR